MNFLILLYLHNIYRIKFNSTDLKFRMNNRHCYIFIKMIKYNHFFFKSIIFQQWIVLERFLTSYIYSILESIGSSYNGFVFLNIQPNIKTSSTLRQKFKHLITSLFLVRIKESFFFLFVFLYFYTIKWNIVDQLYSQVMGRYCCKIAYVVK